jgi:hypothetical protein
LDLAPTTKTNKHQRKKKMRQFLVYFSVALVASQSDTECGNATQPLRTDRKNVLIVGDSISMVPPYTPGGYGQILHTLLEESGVEAQHAGGWYSGAQCSNTVKGLLCTTSTQPNNYLNISGNEMFDVCHLNWGLHDLVAACPPGGTGECEEHVDLPTYGQNLVTLYGRFKKACKNVIWTSTTPNPNITTSMNRTYELVVAYNAEAKSALTAGIGPDVLVIDDLWTAMIDYCGAYYTSCDLQLPKNVHLTPKGENFTAYHAFASIKKALGL